MTIDIVKVSELIFANVLSGLILLTIAYLTYVWGKSQSEKEHKELIHLQKQQFLEQQMEQRKQFEEQMQFERAKAKEELTLLRKQLEEQQYQWKEERKHLGGGTSWNIG